MEMDLEKRQARVTLVGTLSGFVVSLATMFLLMSLAAALGYWSFQFEDLPNLGVPFWRFASFMWVLSSSFGALISVLISRSNRMLDGLLQAFVSWSGAYLVFGGLTLTIVDSNLTPFLSQTNHQMIQMGFLGDSLSLAGALLCGWIAVRLQLPRKSHAQDSFKTPGFFPGVGLSPKGG